MAMRLSKLSLKGFKSIRELTDFEFGNLNILIGPNAAGKSNFISFFRMLGEMLGDRANFREYVMVQSGGANALLFDGREVTGDIKQEMRLSDGEEHIDYEFQLKYTQGDTLMFVKEVWNPHGEPDTIDYADVLSHAAHIESDIMYSREENPVGQKIRNFWRDCTVYQFHNTSMTSRVKQRWSVQDNIQLKADGGNLAPFLMRLQEWEPQHFGRIEETLKLVFPLFDGFVLQPEGNSVLLRWRERGTDRIFGVHEGSDGMIRAMALVSLLSQPPKDLPKILVLDEPELGLHPEAIRVISNLLKRASHHCQLFVATQSPVLINEFSPVDIVVVEREGRESTYKRLAVEQLSEWLEDYTLGELWQKNVLGGNPRL